MTGLEIATGVVLIILSVQIIAVILLQEGRQANLGNSGASESFFDRGKARTDAILSKWTKIIVFPSYSGLYRDADYQVFRA